MRYLIALTILCVFRSTVSLSFKSEEINANFDDRKHPRTALELSGVGVYQQLAWSGFSIDQPRRQKGDEDFVGVEVKSEPNYVGGQVDLFGGLPSITSLYPGSHVAFFDLQRFWWGCSTTEEDTLQQVPGWCTLEVNGYAHDKVEPVAKAVSFFFPKDDITSMAMVETLLPSTFSALTRVEFNVMATKPILYLDNVQYKIYNVTDIGKGLGEVIHSDQTSQSEFVMHVMGGGI